MKRFLALLFLVPALALPAASLDYDLGFSPGGTALEAVVKAIAGAKKTIALAAYEFTSEPVAQALAEAVTRGVKVWVVMDDGAAKSKYSQAAWLLAHGVSLRVNSHYAIFHHKFLVADLDTVETGSFNYTKSADVRNAENALVLRGVPDLAKRYLTEWTRLWDEAEVLKPVPAVRP
jgi:phosphatidylserine/phosphatidylglycerophosphate/cardiolipin synthase-like enzyme